MKKFFVLTALAVICMATRAQKVYGDRPGWTAYTTEDEFSGKRSHYMRYFDEQRVLAAVYFMQGRMGVMVWNDGVLFMDETVEAVTEHHGKLPSREVDYEWRVAMAKGESEEDFGSVKMTFGSVERVGDTFFSTFVFDADTEAMKAGQWIAVRWHDPLRDEQVTRRISLAGFTRCYDECIRRYKKDWEGK